MAGFKNLEKAIVDSKNLTGKVGWFESSHYPAELGGLPVAYVASINEYGVPGHIPPRPTMRPTIIKYKNSKWKKIMEAEVKKIAKGEGTIEGAVEIVGAIAAGDVREAISKLTEPALSEVTIANRLKERANHKKVGSLTKPLVDQRYMIDTLTNITEKTK